MDIDAAWENFISDTPSQIIDKEKCVVNNNEDFKPECSDIYISTQTKIAKLNQPINLYDIFWKLKIIPYESCQEGILKKQMKVNCIDENTSQKLDEKIKNTKDYIHVDTISKINNPNGRKVLYKDVRKINIGLCKKDLISYRVQKKGAFYNCFVLILRIKIKNLFKEHHVKVFNTGKLELPGIQDSSDLTRVLDNLIKVLEPYVEKPLSVDKNNISTVLINSNFSCNYYIERDVLASILKYDYNLHVVYDSCSYPGIQCKFYYNDNYEVNNGICSCNKKCTKSPLKNKNSCKEVSFMIFRTGSVLIVGRCSENILKYIYDFIKNILMTKYKDFIIKAPDFEKKTKQKKQWKKYIYVDN
jgi:hypothetical protein